jgi:hypothetical protein
MMSGLKINYLKSGIFSIGGDNDVVQFYANMFHFQVGTLHLKYLGTLATCAALKNSNWDIPVGRMIKKWDA